MPKTLKQVAEERFWERIDRLGPVYAPLGSRCWLWTGSVLNSGYGRLRALGECLAHRVSYTLFVQINLPKDLCVLHECDNRLCVNPEHLRLGTDKDNIDDMYKKGRQSLNRSSGSQHWSRKYPERVRRRGSPPTVDLSARPRKTRTDRLSEEDVKAIRLLYLNEQVSQTVLAEAFGVCQWTISAIVRRASWKHVK